jgi:hypothetical protein
MIRSINSLQVQKHLQLKRRGINQMTTINTSRTTRPFNLDGKTRKANAKVTTNTAYKIGDLLSVSAANVSHMPQMLQLGVSFAGNINSSRSNHCGGQRFLFILRGSIALKQFQFLELL